MQGEIKSRHCILQRGVKSMIVAEILPRDDAAGSQIFLMHFAAGRCDSPLHLAAGSQISLLHVAVGSQILSLHDAGGVKSYLCMM
jgi:hypothetical protein